MCQYYQVLPSRLQDSSDPSTASTTANASTPSPPSSISRTASSDRLSVDSGRRCLSFNESPTPPKRMRMNTLPSISFDDTSTPSPAPVQAWIECYCTQKPFVFEQLCPLQGEDKEKVRRAKDLTEEQKVAIEGMSSAQVGMFARLFFSMLLSALQDMPRDERKRQYAALRRAILKSANPALTAKFSLCDDCERQHCTCLCTPLPFELPAACVQLQPLWILSGSAC